MKGMNSMTNLYDETASVLNAHGLSVEDIVNVYGEEFSISVDNFLEVSKNTDYDSGFGSAEVANDLIVAGNDWWLERYEYDGSEGWEFKTMATPPEEVKEVKTLGGTEFMWNTLSEMNGGERW